jgi:hypothetical protein
MSRLPGALALSLLLAATAAGCDGSHTCTLIGCLDGVAISFEGLNLGTTYDIAIADLNMMAHAAVPIMTCTAAATDAGYQTLSCSSSEAHSEIGTTVHIRDTTLSAVEVTVSSNGVQLSDRSFDVNYTSKEINGPGCGVCTSASVTMTVPSI